MVAVYPRVVIFTSPSSKVRKVAAARQHRVKYKYQHTKYVHFYPAHFRAR